MFLSNMLKANEKLLGVLIRLARAEIQYVELKNCIPHRI